MMVRLIWRRLVPLPKPMANQQHTLQQAKSQNNFFWWYAVVGYVAYLLALISGSFISSATEPHLKNASFNTGALFNIILFILVGLFSLFALKLVSKNKLTNAQLGLHSQAISLKVLLTGTILGLLFFGLSELIESYSPALQHAGEQVKQTFDIGKNISNDILLLFNIGLFAPVAEEIIFRGIIFNSIYQGLKKHTIIPCHLSLIIALVLSTLGFVFSHGGGGQDEQMWLLALLGITTALAMYYTQSLFAAIAVHAVNNHVVFILMFIEQTHAGSVNSIKFIFISLTCLLLCLPLGLLFGRILVTENKD